MIPERLKRLAELVGRIGTGADVGCDHAYLSHYLLKNDLAQYMIATDINMNPLKYARRTLRPFQSRSQIRQGYGLRPIDPGEVDAIFIGGLGAETIVEILEDGMERFPGTTFALQVNGDPSPLREFLLSKPIYREDIIKENRHYYQIIIVKEGYRHGEQIWNGTGPILQIGTLYKTEVGKNYLKKCLADIEEALRGIGPADVRGQHLREKHNFFTQLLSAEE